jgi:hypothetical protein
MEKQQQKSPAIPAHLLKQIEQCGWAAHLAQEHRERREDKNGTREVRTEIVRSWAVHDQAQLPGAHAAQLWLMGIEGSNVGIVRSVGEFLGLVDAETGEELAGGRTDAIIDTADGKVLVVSWVVGERYDMPEPEEDLGLVALGLAACNGKPFEVAHVYLQDGEAFPRRSPVFPVDDHPALLVRIRKAANTPRDIKCPGSWCGHCRQAPHCEAWLARARTALTTMRKALVANGEGKIEKAPGFELTDDNAGAFYECLEYAKRAREFGYELVKSHARRGGKVIRGDGKALVLSGRDGRVTVTTSEFKDILKRLRQAAQAGESVELAALADALEATIKTGDPYEYPLWQDPSAIGARR